MLKKTLVVCCRAAFLPAGRLNMQVQVLYEDNHVIAVYKPAGVLVQGDDTGDATLADAVKLHLKQAHNKPGNVFLGIVHRLDRPVAGIVVFGKTSKVASRLSEQIRNHTFKTTYHTLVWGEPKKATDTLVNWLKKDEHTNTVKVYEREVEGGLRAELDYEIVEKRGDKTVLKINLKTGRPHQIRAQLSHLGCPIVGDIKYGAPDTTSHLPHHELALCATRVEFKKAVGDEAVVVEIPFNL